MADAGPQVEFAAAAVALIVIAAFGAQGPFRPAIGFRNRIAQRSIEQIAVLAVAAVAVIIAQLHPAGFFGLAASTLAALIAVGGGGIADHRADLFLEETGKTHNRPGARATYKIPIFKNFFLG